MMCLRILRIGTQADLCYDNTVILFFASGLFSGMSSVIAENLEILNYASKLMAMTDMKNRKNFNQE